MKRKKIFILIATLIILMLFVQIYLDNETIEVTTYKIENTKIPLQFDGYKILQLSDLHDKEFGKDNYKLIQEIDKISPDIIVMTGDMVTSNETDFTVFFEIVKELVQKYDVYYVEGNHEQDLPPKYEREILNFLKKTGITILNNKMISIEKDGEKINIYGLQYDLDYYIVSNSYLFTKEKIEDLLGEAEDNQFNILLSHNPRYFDIYSKWGADLTFAGHIHGGMVRIPIFDIAIFSPDELFFPKYNKGVYEAKDSNENKMIVSRGLGKGKRGFRLFNKPEIVVTVLKSSV